MSAGECAIVVPWKALRFVLIVVSALWPSFAWERMKPNVLGRWFGITILMVVVIVATNQVALATSSTSSSLWSPQIAIVWPHDLQGQPSDAAHSQLVNVAVWPSNQVSCSEPPGTNNPWLDQLMVSKNNDVTEPVDMARQWILRPGDGGLFPTMEYDNIPADLVADPNAQYHFVVFGTTPSAPTSAGFVSNVWTHAADARTYLPTPVVPTGVSVPIPNDVDVRIQIVWPHDAAGNYAPPDRATFVNVAVDLFAHGTLESLPPAPPYYYSVGLSAAPGNQPLARVQAREEVTTYTANGQAFPRWVVNDVPVQPGVPYTFVADALEAGGKFPSHHVSVWVHASDARTILPHPQAPPPCTA